MTLEKSKTCEIKLLQKLHATRYSSFPRCGNCEPLCFLGNLNAFASQFPQSHIQALRKFSGKVTAPPPPSKSRSARMPMALPLAFFRFLTQRAKGKEELLGRVLILTVTKLLHWSCVLKTSVFEYRSITSIDPYALLTS